MTIKMKVANTGFHFRKIYKGYNDPPNQPSRRDLMKAIRLCVENAKAVENAIGRLPYDRKTLRNLTGPAYLIIDHGLSAEYLVVSQKRFMKTYKMPKTETALGFFEVVKR